MNYSNPRLHAEFPDWPLGGLRRGLCVFDVQHVPGKGYRFSRVTTGKPKFDTYGGKAAIVDGDDGRTYLLQANIYGIKVSRSDFMNSEEGTVYLDSKPERYKELADLIMQANGCTFLYHPQEKTLAEQAATMRNFIDTHPVP